MNFCYLNTSNSLQLNKLLQSVQNDLKDKKCMAGIKALGLISVLITEPLWCLLETKGLHILEMNEKYTQLIKFFNDALENLGMFMSGKLVPFPELKLKDDKIAKTKYQHNCC